MDWQQLLFKLWKTRLCGVKSYYTNIELGLSFGIYLDNELLVKPALLALKVKTNFIIEIQKTHHSIFQNTTCFKSLSYQGMRQTMY